MGIIILLLIVSMAIRIIILTRTTQGVIIEQSNPYSQGIKAKNKNKKNNNIFYAADQD